MLTRSYGRTIKNRLCKNTYRPRHSKNNFPYFKFPNMTFWNLKLVSKIHWKLGMKAMMNRGDYSSGFEIHSNAEIFRYMRIWPLNKKKQLSNVRLRYSQCSFCCCINNAETPMFLHGRREFYTQSPWSSIGTFPFGTIDRFTMSNQTVLFMSSSSNMQLFTVP
jgi:hypothetical protein